MFTMGHYDTNQTENNRNRCRMTIKLFNSQHSHLKNNKVI
ncbi:hypothetical protein BTJ45_04300 [Bacillus mycoides]|nr:hypothetical protein BTJ45_04300 [Bacillus mycoides]